MVFYTEQPDNGKLFQVVVPKMWDENINSLIRQYFPTGSSFVDITEQDIDKVMPINHYLKNP